MVIEVVNRYHLKGNLEGTINIQRGTELGNPYRIGAMTRDEVIALYEKYLRKMIEIKDPGIIREIYRLVRMHECGEDMKLLCSCAPLKCHGDIVRKVVMELSCS